MYRQHRGVLAPVTLKFAYSLTVPLVVPEGSRIVIPDGSTLARGTRLAPGSLVHAGNQVPPGSFIPCDVTLQDDTVLTGPSLLKAGSKIRHPSSAKKTETVASESEVVIATENEVVVAPENKVIVAPENETLVATENDVVVAPKHKVTIGADIRDGEEFDADEVFNSPLRLGRGTVIKAWSMLYADSVTLPLPITVAEGADAIVFNTLSSTRAYSVVKPIVAERGSVVQIGSVLAAGTVIAADIVCLLQAYGVSF